MRLDDITSSSLRLERCVVELIHVLERDTRRSEKLTGFRRAGRTQVRPASRNSLPGGNSEREPPDPIPNSEVKTLCADGSVPFRHARVGHCQALNEKTPVGKSTGVFLFDLRIRLRRFGGNQWDAIGTRRYSCRAS